MRNEIRKIACIFFMGLLLQPLFLTFYFQVQKYFIREKMRDRLETHRLVNVSIPQQEVNWVKKNKEININGEMFDVKSMELKNGVYFFTGLFDEEESMLNGQEEESSELENENLISKLVKNMGGLFHEPFAIQTDPISPTRAAYGSYNYYLPDAVPTIITPPPQAG